MAVLEVTKKQHIYHTLYRLNLSFSAIVARCRKLQETGVFKSKDARLFQGLTQELQSEINEVLLGTMHDIELEDYNRFGKIRLAREKELRDSKDVLVRAEKSKRKGENRSDKKSRR